MSLAWPSIFENVMVTMVNYVDTAMIGSLGKEATSAVAINASPMWLINSVSMAVSVGGTVMVARSWGAEEYLRAGVYAKQSLVLGTLLGVTMMLAVLLLAPFIPVWMGGAPIVHADATTYMRIVACSFIPHYAGLAMAGILRGSGNTKTPMRITLGANLLNAAGNYLLIFPTRMVGLFPEHWSIHLRWTMWGAGMGVSGAAISTSVSMAIAGICLFIYLSRQENALRFSFRLSYHFHRRDLWDMLRIGLPAAGERVAISLGHTLFTSVVAGLGVAQLAAHHLAITAEAICYNPVYGFSTAATTMVGQSLGAEDPEQATRYGRINIRLGFLLMMLAGAVLFFFPEQLIRIFTPDKEVIRIGAYALRVIAFAEPFFGLAIVSSGALRGAGDTIAPLVIGIACMWGLRISLALVLVRGLQMGLLGAWVAMGSDLILRGLLTYIRFRSGKWKTTSLYRTK